MMKRTSIRSRVLIVILATGITGIIAVCLLLASVPSAAAHSVIRAQGHGQDLQVHQLDHVIVQYGDAPESYSEGVSRSFRPARSRIEASCPASGTWYYPLLGPYLNRYADGNCSYTLKPTTLPSMTLLSGTSYMEDSVTVPTGVTVELPSNATLDGSSTLAGSLTVAGTLLLDAGAQLPNFRSSIYVSPQGTLTVGAGSTISFAPNHSLCPMLWNNGGVLNLNGTAGSPIHLTSSGATPAPGDWVGVIYTNRGSGVASGNMSYAQVSYGGCTNQWSSSGPNYNTGIQINGSSPSLDHVTVDHSLNNGLEIDDQVAAATPTLTNLTLTNNGGGAWHGYAIEYDFPPTDLSGISGLSVSGNYYNAIAIGPSANYTGAGTWPNLGVPYTLTTGSCNCYGNLTIATGAQLTIGSGVTISESLAPGSLVGLDIGVGTAAPGTQLILGANVSVIALQGSISVHPQATFTVGAGSTISFAPHSLCHMLWNNGGVLNLNGTAGSPISLTSSGATPAPGDWVGVIYTNRGSGVASGSMSYAQVSYGGCTNQWSSSGPNYNTGIQINGSSPSLDHVTVDHSLNNGMEIDDQMAAAAPSLSNDAFNSNIGNAVQYDFLPADLTNQSFLSATGNAQNAIQVPGGALTSTGTWPNCGLPIRITGSLTLNAGANLTMAAGSQVSYIAGALRVNSGAILALQGGNLIAFSPGSVNLWADTGSTLSLTGSPTAPITLTSASTTPSAGDWQGVVLASGSTDTLSFVSILDAGRSVTYNATTYTTALLLAANATLSYPTVAASAGNDVEVAGGVQPSLRFGNYGMVASGHYGVANDGWTSGTPLLDATYSWWGDTSGPTVADNPNGKGAAITTGVNYRPWEGQIPGPTMTMSATSGPSGTQIMVNGSGFSTRETVKIYIGSQMVATTQVQFDIMIANRPLGQFHVNVVVPALPPGSYTILAIGQQSGRIALAGFTLTAHASRSSRSYSYVVARPEGAPAPVMKRYWSAR